MPVDVVRRVDVGFNQSNPINTGVAGNEIEHDSSRRYPLRLEIRAWYWPLLGFGQGPFTAFVPQLVAGQPPPRGEDGEHAGKLSTGPTGWLPAWSLVATGKAFALQASAGSASAG